MQHPKRWDFATASHLPFCACTTGLNHLAKNHSQWFFTLDALSASNPTQLTKQKNTHLSGNAIA